MANFVLKKLARNDLSKVQKEIEFKDITLTMAIKVDPCFERAMSLIHEKLSMPKELSKKTLADRSEFSPQEAILFIIGEYLISKWNVIDTDNKPLEINGKNFMALFEQVGDFSETQEFITLVFSTFNDISTEFNNQRLEIKKKP